LAEGSCRVPLGVCEKSSPDIWPPHASRRHVPPPLDAVWCEEPQTPSKRLYPSRRQASDCTLEPQAPESLSAQPEIQLPSRRMYPQRDEASALGATRDFTSSCLRRPCPDGPLHTSSKKTTRRHFHDECLQAHWDKQEKQAHTPHSRRHVQSHTQEHLSNGGPQVTYTEYSPCSRRHCAELGGRPASVGAARRGILPHQRRHLAPEDHMVGPYIHSGSAEPSFVSGNSKARASSHPPGSNNMASVLCTEGSAWAPPGARKCEPTRRTLEAEGHLLGGFLARDTSSGVDPFFSRRHYGEPPVHMIGGTMRSPAPAWSEARRSWDPSDNLIGGVFRFGSAPRTPAQHSEPVKAASAATSS